MIQKFMIQALFSTLILCFCIFQLGKTNVQDSDKSYYWSVVMAVTGYWLPSPKEPDMD